MLEKLFKLKQNKHVKKERGRFSTPLAPFQCFSKKIDYIRHCEKIKYQGTFIKTFHNNIKFKKSIFMIYL